NTGAALCWLNGYQQLIHELADENRQRRTQAVEELTKLGKTAVPLLIKALDDERPYVASGAFKSLLEIGKPAVPSLIDLVKRDKRRECQYRLRVSASVLRRVFFRIYFPRHLRRRTKA